MYRISSLSIMTLATGTHIRWCDTCFSLDINEDTNAFHINHHWIIYRNKLCGQQQIDSLIRQPNANPLTKTLTLQYYRLNFFSISKAGCCFFAALEIKCLISNGNTMRKKYKGTLFSSTIVICKCLSSVSAASCSTRRWVEPQAAAYMSCVTTVSTWANTTRRFSGGRPAGKEPARYRSNRVTVYV